MVFSGCLQTAMPSLQIQLLGAFHLRYNGEPLTSIHQIRLQSLLAYLVLHSYAPQTRQHLAFLFWPDSIEAQAYSNLRKALHALRSALPDAEQYLYTDAREVQWRPNAPYVLDVALFEQHLTQAEQDTQSGDVAGGQAQLEAALGVYAGDLLPGCYDDWIAPERERLRERFLDALARLIDGLEQTHEYAAAIRQANRLLRVDPLHEETYRRLMRLHALNGDRAGALRIYHTCAATLQRELGVEPSPPTQEMYAQLLSLETAPIAPSARQGKRPRDALVGRHADWQHLMLAWERAVQGHAQFVFIGGDPGIGKTRLVEELVRWVRQQGFVAAYTRAYAAEGRLAYDPLAEWLRSEALQPHLSALEDVWLVEAARLAPDLRTQRPNLPTPQPLTESWQRRHFFEALARAVLSVQTPLLLALDDLQWCDRETLEWLHYLLRFDPHRRLLVVGTARLGEIDAEHPLRSLLRELRQTSQLIEWELAPLDDQETAQLAQQVANRSLDAAQMAAIQRATEGNPLLVQEMVWAEMLGGSAPQDAHGQHPAPAHESLLPAKMASVIESRLARLSPEARQLVALAATIGRSFTFAMLCQASGEDEDGLAAALDELWQQRIVRDQGSDAYDFSHDKIREVAYAAISPIRRRRLHHQVAQALEQVHASELDMVSARIAAHYRQAGDAAKAAAYYLCAATKMEFGFAYEEMVAHLQQGLTALQDQPRTQENVTLEIAMLLALGRVLTTREGWGSPRAIELFERASQDCLDSNNLAQLVRAQDYLQIAYSDNGNLPRALVLAQSNLESATKLGNPAEIEGAHGSLGFILCFAGELGAAREHLEQAAALAAASPEARTSAHRALSYAGAYPYTHVLWLLGFPDRAQCYLQAVLAAQEAHVGPFDLLSAYEFCVLFHQWRREWQEMQAYALKFTAVTEQYEYTAYRPIGHLYTSAAAAALGQPHSDRARLRQSIDDLRAGGLRMFVPNCLYLLAKMCLYAGDFAEGLATLDEALALAAQTGEHLWDVEAHRLRGELLAAEGKLQAAEMAYQQALALAQGQQAKSLELRAALSLGRLWQAQGKRREAYNLLAPIYNWFSEGFDTPDLKDTQALLTALAA
jgi:DNA-binding SARP family transcriptional activator